MAEKYIAKSLCDMAAGDLVEVFLIVDHKGPEALVKTVTGSDMFRGSGTDGSMKDMPIVMFDYKGDVHEYPSGTVMKVRGQVCPYKDALQIKASDIRIAQEGEYNLMELVPVAPIDVNGVIKPYLNSVIGSMKDADYANIVKHMIKHMAPKMATCPAAKGIHHAFIGGEMMHVYNMVRVAKQLIQIYPIVNEDLLIAGIICHDMYKEREYTMSPVGLLTGMSLQGKLFNHLQKGAENVALAGQAVGAPQEKIELLQHLILSHHEKPEWGSPVGPAVAEAWMLCMIDNLDAKMETVTEKLEQMEVGDVVDKAINGLPLYKHWEPQQ